MGGRGASSASRSLANKPLDTLERERDKLRTQSKALFKKTLKSNPNYDLNNLEANKKKLAEIRKKIERYDDEIKKRAIKKSGSHTKDDEIREKIAKTHTSTYDRARKRRISNYTKWFYGEG